MFNTCVIDGKLRTLATEKESCINKLESTTPQQFVQTKNSFR